MNGDNFPTEVLIDGQKVSRGGLTGAKLLGLADFCNQQTARSIYPFAICFAINHNVYGHYRDVQQRNYILRNI